jgi:hypothetical protein
MSPRRKRWKPEVEPEAVESSVSSMTQWLVMMVSFIMMPCTPPPSGPTYVILEDATSNTPPTRGTAITRDVVASKKR